MLALTKHTRDGRVATVTVETAPAAGLHVVARVGGEVVGNHTGPYHQAAGLPDGHVAAIGRLALTPEETHRVWKIYRDVADRQPRSLRAERARLVDSVRVAEQTRADERSDAFDRGTLDQHLARRDIVNEQLITQAEVALTEFDHAHPEVRDEVEDRRDEVTRRHMWD